MHSDDRRRNRVLAAALVVFGVLIVGTAAVLSLGAQAGFPLPTAPRLPLVGVQLESDGSYQIHTSSAAAAQAEYVGVFPAGTEREAARAEALWEIERVSSGEGSSYDFFELGAVPQGWTGSEIDPEILGSDWVVALSNGCFTAYGDVSVAEMEGGSIVLGSGLTVAESRKAEAFRSGFSECGRFIVGGLEAVLFLLGSLSCLIGGAWLWSTRP